MKRRLGLLCGLGLLLVGCREDMVGSDWHLLQPPVAAQDFTLPALNGSPISLASLRGHIVIVDFWATWCGPCRYALPSVEAIYRQYHSKGVEVLLINEGESAEQVRRWAGRRFTAPILLDEDTKVGAAYGVTGIPHMLVINPEGQVYFDHSGYSGGLERSLRTILDSLLAAPAAAR